MQFFHSHHLLGSSVSLLTTNSWASLSNIKFCNSASSASGNRESSLTEPTHVPRLNWYNPKLGLPPSFQLIALGLFPDSQRANPSIIGVILTVAARFFHTSTNVLNSGKRAAEDRFTNPHNNTSTAKNKTTLRHLCFINYF